MIFDFSKTFKTYDADSYKKEFLSATRCPKCRAVGRFNLHGSYHRYAAYFDKAELVRRRVKIRRVRCRSCKSTHAVMPGDLIPYAFLSLFVTILILAMFYLKKVAVLKIADTWGFSHQFIYSVLFSFRLHADRIYQYFRETSSPPPDAGLDYAGITALISKPFIEFQSGYVQLNRRPCFMCKFFYKSDAVHIGLTAPMGAVT